MRGQVSVVIPTYNGSRFICEALESVFAQTVQPSEIIVVDDASTDGTVSTVEKFSANSPIPINVIRLHHNSGCPPLPTNIGIESASSEYIALLDQDDWMTPIKIETLSYSLIKNSDAALAFGQYGHINSHGVHSPPNINRYNLYPKNGGVISAKTAFDLLVTDAYHYGGAGGIAFTKKSWLECGGIRRSFKIAWDYDFAVRITSRGMNVVYCPKVVYNHRRHDDNLSLGKSAELIKYCERVRILRDCLLSKQLSEEQSNTVLMVLQDAILGAAYWERKGGSYAQALKNYATAAQHCGYWSAATVGIVKTLITPILRPGNQSHKHK